MGFLFQDVIAFPPTIGSGDLSQFAEEFGDAAVDGGEDSGGDSHGMFDRRFLPPTRFDGFCRNSFDL